MRTRSGFTLIELLVVVAIIGILSGIATVQFQNYIKRAKFVETKSLIGEMALRIETIKIDEQKYPSSYDIYALARKLTETSRSPMNVANKHIQMRRDGDDPYTDIYETGTTLDPVQGVISQAIGGGLYSSKVVVSLDDNDKRGDSLGPIIVDSWGTPIFYISSDTYCRANRCNTESNWPNTAPAAYVTSFDTNRAPNGRSKPQNATSFQLISFGPDRDTNDHNNRDFGGIGSMVWDDDYDNDGNGKKDTADEGEDDVTNF